MRQNMAFSAKISYISIYIRTTFKHSLFVRSVSDISLYCAISYRKPFFNKMKKALSFWP